MRARDAAGHALNGPRARALQRVGLVLVLALLVAAPVAAQQQEACRPPRLLVSEGPESWDPGATFTYQLAVENNNEPPVESVTARVDVAAPAGWSVALSQTSILLRPGDAPVVAVTVTAPQRGTGVATGELLLNVQFTCHRTGAGGFDTRASASTSVPVALEAIDVPWVIVITGALIIGGATAGLYAMRWRKGPLGLESDAPDKPVAPGSAVQFPVRVANRRRAPDVVTLTVTGTPPGWSSHVAVPELSLEGREERDLWVSLRAPRDAPFGEEVTVTLHARPKRDEKAEQSVQLTVRVRREE